MTVAGEVKSLFGGAIELVAPHSFLDASQIREVPDNQEVFVDMTSDDSLIVELLESVKDVDASQAATFHFNNLADEMESTSHSIQSIEVLDPNTFFTKPLPQAESATLLTGEQTVTKFRSQSAVPHKVAILLGVIRLKEPYETDVLLVMNRPEMEGQGSVETAGLGEEFQKMFKSFVINDFELFGAS